MASGRIAALLATATLLACLTVGDAQANTSTTIGDGSAMASAGATGANNVAASTGASTTGGSVPATNGGCPEGTMASASASVGDDVSTADACVPIEDMDDTTTDGAAPDSVPAVEDIGTGELAAAGAVYVSLAAIVGSVALGMAVL